MCRRLCAGLCVGKINNLSFCVSKCQCCCLGDGFELRCFPERRVLLNSLVLLLPAVGRTELGAQNQSGREEPKGLSDWFRQELAAQHVPARHQILRGGGGGGLAVKNACSVTRGSLSSAGPVSRHLGLCRSEGAFCRSTWWYLLAVKHEQ